MQAVNEALERKSINHIEFTRSEILKHNRTSPDLQSEFLVTKQKN